MNFEYFNPNPDKKFFNSGKPKNWTYKDSSVRALCKISDKSWDEVFTSLFTLAKNEHNMMDSKEVINIYLISKGFEYKTFGKPKQDTKRPLLKEFVSSHPTGTYILYLRDYYICLIDGIIYDVNNNLSNVSVYSYWEK